MLIAIVGGTGPEGIGLATRFAYAGEDIIIGSRSIDRAKEAAAKVTAVVPRSSVRGLSNTEAAENADVIFIAVPLEGHLETLKSLSPFVNGKVVIDVVAPLEFRDGRVSAISIKEGSVAEQARAALPQAKVVSGFHHPAASELPRLDKPIEADIIICGDDADAKATAMALAEKIEGARAIDGGGLANSQYVETFTAILISINRRYKVRSSIRITGI
jgi:NADPH-dependent F420 reductase